MTVLTRDKILAADDLNRKEVQVPEWGGSVFLRVLTGAERDRFESEVMAGNTADGKGNKTNALLNIRAKLLCMCIVDEKGEQIFNRRDIDNLSQKSGRVLGRLFFEAQKVNGMTKADIDELMGNSQSGQPDDTTSD